MGSRVLTVVAPVGNILPQGLFHHREGKGIPGDIRLPEQFHCQAFRSWTVGRFKQRPPKHHIYLTDVRDAVHREEGLDVHPRAGLFPGFAQRCLVGRFPILHESRGQRPEAVARVDGALTKQNPVFPFGDAAGDDLRVFIMNRVTDGAHMARQVVALRDALFHRLAAMAAIVHEISPNNGNRRSRTAGSRLPAHGGPGTGSPVPVRPARSAPGPS